MHENVLQGGLRSIVRWIHCSICCMRPSAPLVARKNLRRVREPGVLFASERLPFRHLISMEEKKLVKPDQRIAHESPWPLGDRMLRLLWEFAWFVFCEWTPKPLNPWRLF